MMSTLFLSSLRLSHFRSHQRARFELDGRPVAIHGPNGAGKTNILEAVSILSPGRGLRRASSEAMTRKPEALGWKVQAELVALGHPHDIETWSEAGASRQTKIDGKAAPQITLGQIARILWLIPAMDRLWIEGAEGRRRFLDRATLSFDPSHAGTVLAYEKAMRERNRLLKDMVRDTHWYAALERQMADAGAAIHRSREEALSRLTAAQDAAETAFPTAGLMLRQSEPACDAPDDPEALYASFAESRSRDMVAGRTLIGPHRADLDAIYVAKGVSARECSTGEQKALLISLILANGRALAADFGAPPILLLDEVAAHLDPARRAALYDEIHALGAQAFMTGTEMSLFDTLDGRCQHIEVQDDNGVSRANLKAVL